MSENMTPSRFTASSTSTSKRCAGSSSRTAGTFRQVHRRLLDWRCSRPPTRGRTTPSRRPSRRSSNKKDRRDDEAWSAENRQIFTVGMGLNTGEVVMGNLGSSDRLNYTVIGDNVNTAARLYNVAKGGQIIISESTYNGGERPTSSSTSSRRCSSRQSAAAAQLRDHRPRQAGRTEHLDAARPGETSPTDHRRRTLAAPRVIPSVSVVEGQLQIFTIEAVLRLRACGAALRMTRAPNAGARTSISRQPARRTRLANDGGLNSRALPRADSTAITSSSLAALMSPDSRIGRVDHLKVCARGARGGLQFLQRRRKRPSRRACGRGPPRSRSPDVW